MKENLVKLYNTLSLIETKGENTKIMAQCLQFVEQMVQTEAAKQEINIPKEDE